MWENLALTYLAAVDLEGKKEKTNFFLLFTFARAEMMLSFNPKHSMKKSTSFHRDLIGERQHAVLRLTMMNVEKTAEEIKKKM